MKKLAFLLMAMPLISALAQADISIINHPGNVFGDENVQYNEGALADNAPLIQGITNHTDTIVDFYGAGEDLFTPSKGQARIEGVDGGLDAMTIKLHEPNTDFTSLILNLNASKDGQVTFVVHPLGESDFTQTFDIDKNGENFFRILTANNETITSVDFTTTVDLQDVRQVRIGFAPGAVPEPASCAALGLGAAAMIRRRKAKKS
jgi:hypothetical protein